MTPETLLTLAVVGALLSLAVVVVSACVEFFATVEESDDVPPEEERAYLLALSGVVTFPRNH